VSDNKESETSKPELPCCEGDLCRDDWHRNPIRLGAFFLVVLLIQAMDVVLTLRIEDLGNGADTTEKLIRAIGDLTDVLFVVVLVVVIVDFLRRRFIASRESHSQFTLLILCVYLSAASLNVIVNMITLVMAPSLQNASQNWLILDLVLLFASNMLAFSLWYQLADAYLEGGAFDFPPNAAHPDDPPRWIDYIVSFLQHTINIRANHRRHSNSTSEGHDDGADITVARRFGCARRENHRCAQLAGEILAHC